MKLSPVASKTDLVSARVELNGQEMPGDYIVESIQVTREVNRLGTARIVLADGDPATQDFAISAADVVVPGVRVQISMGYCEDTRVVFKGIIVKHGVRVRENGKPQLVLTCTDSAVKLTAGRRSAVYRGMCERDIWNTLLEAQGLSLAPAQADAGTAEGMAAAPDLVRYYSTDWDFMLIRAEAAGQVVVVDDAVVSIGPPALADACGLRLAYGDSIIALNAEMDARNQLSSVSASGWMRKSRLARVCGTVSFRGNAGAVPGKTIELAGLGGRFNGDVYMARVEHTLEDGNWVTEVGFGMAPHGFAASNPDVHAPPASGLLPAAQGLQVGTVLQIDADPLGQMRVLVDLPLLDSASQGVWARLGAPYATSQGGIFFMPEPGDEVTVGFLNNDPRFPVVLGSLYSSKQTNAHKGIVTKTGLKILLEDVDKIITISTPGQQSIVIDGEKKTITITDASQNTVTMSQGGVTVASQGTLSITAADITIAASGTLTMSGAAVTRLSSDGVLTVQGSEVKLN